MDLAVIASTVVQIVCPVMLQIQVVLVKPRSQLVIHVTQESTEWVAKATAQPVSMAVEKGKRKRGQLVHTIAQLEHMGSNGEAYKVLDAL